jgi:acetyltransferase-like isoleucine patch superfamily enzyme
MRRIDPKDFPNCTIAPDAAIEGEQVEIGEGAQIGAGVTIAAGRIRIGRGAVIEAGTRVRALSCLMESFVLGDHALIGHSNQILAPLFEMGDYSQLHNSGLHSGYRALTIGHNCWIGQNSILNCTERLTIGNNVRIGTQSQLWTHVASGELLEGCTLYGENPLLLEDNVWIVGGAVVSPGLVLGRNSIVMTGSVLTRSTEPFHTYAGVPAKDVTEKLGFWRPVTDEDKVAMMEKFAAEFRHAVPDHGARVRIVSGSWDGMQAEAGDVVVAQAVSDWTPARDSGVSLFDLSSKRYLKQSAPAEIAWIKWLAGFRARFLPLAD